MANPGSMNDGQRTMGGGEDRGRWTGAETEDGGWRRRQRTVDGDGDRGWWMGIRISSSIYKGCVKKKERERKAQLGEGRPPVYRSIALRGNPRNRNP